MIGKKLSFYQILIKNEPDGYTFNIEVLKDSTMELYSDAYIMV